MVDNPSIKDVAKKAGVSIGTVDRVLHNRGQVSEATRRTVQKVIKEINYQPNILARSLALKREFKIGILLPFSSNKNDYWYYPAIGIQKAANEHQYFKPKLVKAYYDLHSLKDFEKKIHLLLNAEVDGVVTAPIYKTKLGKFLLQLNEKGIKYSLLDSDIENSRRSFFIGQDPVQGGRVAAQLLDLTFQNDASEVLALQFNPVPQGIPTVKLRQKGFRDFFNDSPTNTIIRTNSVTEKTKENIFSNLKQIFKETSNLKAVFVSDSKSYLVAEFLEQHPIENLKVVGFDLLEENVRFLKKGLIHFLIHQQPGTQGYQALNQLLNSLNQPKNEIPDQDIPINIITRENIRYYDS